MLKVPNTQSKVTQKTSGGDGYVCYIDNGDGYQKVKMVRNESNEMNSIGDWCTYVNCVNDHNLFHYHSMA